MDTAHTISFPSLELLTPVNKKLWGMDIAVWQRRAFGKIGVNNTATGANILFLKTAWVLSTPLALALRNKPNTVLIVGGKVAAAHVGKNGQFEEVRAAVLRNDMKNLKMLGLSLQTPEQLAGFYNDVLRKRETPFAYSIKKTPRLEIEQKLFNSSYKGITDFVTKYFWPRPAFQVTRFCAALKITPNMVTGLSFIMVLAAFYFFMNGQWILGMTSAWFMTFLDTVDGKLARTTMQASKWGHIFDHGIDLIHPPFWYWAWYVGLGLGGAAAPNWLFPCLIAILTGYWVDRIVEGLFILRFKFHIHMWKPIDSFVRIYTARRNPNTFIFMCALLIMPLYPRVGFLGFGLVAIWTWACIAFHVLRLLQAYLTPSQVVSWMKS